MSIFEEKAYGVKCDVCDKVYMDEYRGFTLWVDENSAKEAAQDDYWLIEDGKCYCPDCFEVGEDDNVTIKDKKYKCGDCKLIEDEDANGEAWCSFHQKPVRCYSKACEDILEKGGSNA